MKSILLIIRKKTLVPTKYQLKHQHRSDWKPICKIDYEKSKEIFFELGGPVKTDGQFAKVIYENYGEGEYSVIYWCKGRKGFRSFIHFIVDSHGYFKQVKAGVYRPRGKLNMESECFRLKQEYVEFKSDAIWDEIVEMEKKIGREERAQGPYPYLESLHPRYKVHHVEGYEVEEEDEEKEFITGMFDGEDFVEPSYVEPEVENVGMGFF